jgi:hypothetical protein
VHAASQLPQFSGSAAALISQPFTTLLSQSKKPSAQVLVHWPLLQVVPGHGVSQAPQWVELVSRFTHWPLQQVSLLAQLAQGSPPSAGRTHWFVLVSQTNPGEHSPLALHAPPFR